jgi:hypothetical protein
MGGFMSTNAPKPMRSNITLKKRSVSFGNQQGGESNSMTSDPNMRITVIKGS